MVQLTDDCFAHGGSLMNTAEALDLLNERLHAITRQETVPVVRASGRILATDLTAGMDVPPHDNSAVDGYAVFFDDLNQGAETRLPVTGRVAAGHPLKRPPTRGEALRIFTGAPVPGGNEAPGGTVPGPDTILMQEDCREEDGAVIIPPGIRQGANHRKRSEDIAAGSTILHQGDRLRPQDVAIATSVGLSELNVFAPLRVALFSSGDEIRDPGAPLAAGAIYDSNRYSLHALLEGLGCSVTDLGILPDDLPLIRDALEKAAATHDLLITSGGVSVGEEDHIRNAIEALGGLHFWRLAIKPGRPLALGQIGKVPFIGLPGNPVAVMVTFLRFARPAILKLAGASWRDPRFFRVTAAFSHKKKSGRREWVRVKLESAADGSLQAHKFPRQGAGILSSMVAADGLVELPEDLTHLSEDTTVDFLPFTEVLT